MAWWKKVIVMAGGPTVNIADRVLPLLGRLRAPTATRTTEPNPGPPVIETVSDCVLPYAEEGRACTADDPPTPAIAAGLQPGDVITSASTASRSPTGTSSAGLIRDNADGEAVIGYERDGEPMTGTTNTTVAGPADLRAPTRR